MQNVSEKCMNESFIIDALETFKPAGKVDVVEARKAMLGYVQAKAAYIHCCSVEDKSFVSPYSRQYMWSIDGGYCEYVKQV